MSKTCYLSAVDELDPMFHLKFSVLRTVSSVTFEVTMCKVMTRVMTLTTIAQHGHDLSHYPRKIQHAQTPADVTQNNIEISH